GSRWRPPMCRSPRLRCCLPYQWTWAGREVSGEEIPGPWRRPRRRGRLTRVARASFACGVLSRGARRAATSRHERRAYAYDAGRTCVAHELVWSRELLPVVDDLGVFRQSAHVL